VRIEVTAEDIAAGKPGSPCACPIALACKRAGVAEPDVFPSAGPDEASPGREGHVRYGEFSDGRRNRRSVSLPFAASTFAHDFDAHRPVVPFSFDLDVTP
jgi:hypothetical protein